MMVQYRSPLWVPLIVVLIVPPAVILLEQAWAQWWIIPCAWAAVFVGWLAGGGAG